ncbi:hypothetical protein BD769DRAFT_1471298 [Suillus cothurnatus]|nr:hypothetical protein BD769DRAFT_1471298 [Suillus cothurnatus]
MKRPRSRNVTSPALTNYFAWSEEQLNGSVELNESQAAAKLDLDLFCALSFITLSSINICCRSPQHILMLSQHPSQSNESLPTPGSQIRSPCGYAARANSTALYVVLAANSTLIL